MRLECGKEGHGKLTGNRKLGSVWVHSLEWSDQCLGDSQTERG